jgi:hypothetical protein
MNVLLVAGAEIVPALVLIGSVAFEQWRRRQAGERPPQCEKLLRQAGHTLRQQLEDKRDAFNMWFALAIMGGVLFGIMLSSEIRGYLGGYLVGLLAAVFGTVMGCRTLLAIRRLRLGLLGEQAVAEHLQMLAMCGYSIFHDVRGIGAWNIDHVVVGPAGVFAIETKTRTKKPGRFAEKDYQVVFDGKSLAFPWGMDAAAPAQAWRNAEWLAGELSKSTGDQVPVRPLLAIPGWFVTLKAPTELKVFNAKQIPGFVLKEPPLLGQATIRRIAYQLDQRCRDVEF